jgi:putative DNA primase/helicase
LRKVAGADYRPGERLPLWERVVDEALGGDADFVAGFQRACGYSATGDTREEVFFILHGPTRSVKSTICDALAAGLGDYVHNGVSSETWVEQRNVGGARGDLVQLAGVRMAISPESSKKNTMATALIKAFTGGDPITAAAKYQHEQTMTPTAKVWLHTNEIPRLPDDDDAIWRRAIIFPFNHPPAVPDPSIKATLKDASVSGAGVLSWVVEGFAAWQRYGLAVPDIVKHETLCVRLGMDPLQGWWEECCAAEEGVRTSNESLRESWEKWRKSYQVRDSVGPKEWGVRMKARGLESYFSHGVRGWIGVSLVGADVQKGLGC